MLLNFSAIKIMSSINLIFKYITQHEILFLATQKRLRYFPKAPTSIYHHIGGQHFSMDLRRVINLSIAHSIWYSVIFANCTLNKYKSEQLL
jgi:hypothetical protein